MAVPGTSANPLYVTSSTAVTDEGVIAGQGRKVTTSAGTAVALAASTTCKWVLATALTSNTQQVNVGLTGVIAAAGTSTGVPLLPGASVLIPVANVSTVFVNSRVDAEGVSFIYGN